jgi:lysophospholipase L1-like esterase
MTDGPYEVLPVVARETRYDVARDAHLQAGILTGDTIARAAGAAAASAATSAGNAALEAEIAQTALRARARYDRAAQSPTPLVSVAAAAPGSTPTLHPGSLGTGSGDQFTSVNTKEFSFSAGVWVKALLTFPRYNAARSQPNPDATAGGYGSGVVEFATDAPVLTIQQILGELGSFQLIADDVEVYRCTQPIRTGTAQAGTANTITLDTGASAVNGFYFTRWVRITGGTGYVAGAPIVRQITGYVGSTKVATVGKPFDVTPDATTTFEIARSVIDNNTSSGLGFVTIDWAGERRWRTYRLVIQGASFLGVYTDALSTIMPSPPALGRRIIWRGDSFSAGTGSDGRDIDSLATVAANLLGSQIANISVGSTGYLAKGSFSVTADDHMFPAFNSWYVRPEGSTAGSFTLTQNGITITIASGASAATVQSALDTAFGTGAWYVAGNTATYWLFSRSAPDSTAVMTADFSGLTGGFKYLSRYLGHLAPLIPKDATGRVVPFDIVLANGHNDTTSNGFTSAALTAAVTSLILKIRAAYPVARIWVMGIMYLPGSGNVSSDVVGANNAITAACQAVLPTINGVLPFIDTITDPWVTGSGSIGNLTGGPSDTLTDTDNVHPAPGAHRLYGRRIALWILAVLGRTAPNSGTP